MIISLLSSIHTYLLLFFFLVGKPIAVPKLKEGQTEATEEQLLETQRLYIEELENIYNKYKDIYAKDRKQELRIIN